MNKDGEYVKVTKRGQDPLNSQKLFGKEATQLSKPKDIAENRVFEPEYRDDHGL